MCFQTFVRMVPKIPFESWLVPARNFIRTGGVRYIHVIPYLVIKHYLSVQYLEQGYQYCTLIDQSKMHFVKIKYQYLMNVNAVTYEEVNKSRHLRKLLTKTMSLEPASIIDTRLAFRVFYKKGSHNSEENVQEND